MSLSVYRVEEGGELHHVCASSKEDVFLVLRESGMLDDLSTREDFERSEPEIDVLPGTQMLKVDCDDGRGHVDQTCDEWIASDGRGLVCSSVF